MWSKAKEAAAALKAKTADAVSDIDLGSAAATVKGKITSGVEGVTAKASDIKDGMGDRLTHPKDVYEEALDAVAGTIHGAMSDAEIVAVLDTLKQQNPYA